MLIVSKIVESKNDDDNFWIKLNDITAVWRERQNARKCFSIIQNYSQRKMFIIEKIKIEYDIELKLKKWKFI